MMTNKKDNGNTNKRKLVYVAGPYQGNTKENIENAEKVSIELIKRGFDVITPHKNTAGYERYEDGNITRSTWLNMDLNILSRCDAIYVMNDSSTSDGTAAEIAFAKENNIPFIKSGNTMGDKKSREEVIEVLKRIAEEVESDPEVAKKAEESQRKYGTLTAEDLALTFTV